MLTGSILLLLGMSIVATILILVLIASKLHIAIKVSTTAMVVITVMITYFSLTMLNGWPYKSEFPEGRYKLISFYPDEPNELLTIWVIKNEKDLNWFTSLLTNTKKPRSIELVYNKEMHEQLQKIMSMASGQPSPVKFQEVEGKKEQKNWNTDDQETLQYVLPDIQVMEK